MRKILGLTIPVILFLGNFSTAFAATSYCYTENLSNQKCFSTQSSCESAFNTAQSTNGITADGDCSNPVETISVDTTEQTTNYTPLAPLPGIQNKDGFVNLSNYLPNIFNLAIGIAAVLAVIMIVIGGVQYMSTDAISGKSEGRERITYAVGGLILAIAAWLILYTINPALLNFNVAQVDKKDLPVQEYSSLDAAPNGWYTSTQVISPGKHKKYGPYKSLEKCESSFVSDFPNQKAFFQGCLDEFEDPEVLSSLSGTKPGFYSSFNLMVLDGDDPFVYFGPYSSSDFCESTPLNGFAVSGKYFHWFSSGNGSPECDNSLIESAVKEVYLSESAIPNRGIYKRNTNGRIVSFYGPYLNISECQADSNVNGVCNEYGAAQRFGQYPVGSPRPIGSYKRLGVFIDQGKAYTGRIPSEERCSAFGDVDTRIALNKDLAEQQQSDADKIFWDIFLWGVTDKSVRSGGGYLIQNVSCQEVAGESDRSYVDLSTSSTPGAYLDITYGEKSKQSTVYRGPYSESSTCSSNQPTTEPGVIEGGKLIIEQSGCVLNQK